LGIACLIWGPEEWTRRNRPEIDLSGARSYLGEPLNDIHSARSCIKKGVQVGATESIAVSRALHFVDCWRGDVLYLFPTSQVASEFSAGRFDPILARSEYLRSIFTDIDSVHHKRAGNTNFYCRGSNSEAQLVSIPISFLIVDEFDRMDLNNLSLARDRLEGQKIRMELDISTPTHAGMGIDLEYANSDQKRYLLECPNCKERLPVSWNSIFFAGDDASTASWRCASCGMPWTQEEKIALQSKGVWVAGNPGSTFSGFQIPGLLNPMRSAPDFVRRYLESRTSETQTQIFHNSVLGEAYSPEGSRVTDDLILAAQTASPYPSERTGKDVAVGVDVGAVQHVAIMQIEAEGKIKLLRAFTVPTLESLPDALKPYSPACIVIDSMPERQKAKEIQARFNRARWQSCWLALYPEMKDSIRWNKQLGMVDIHRTEILDEVVGLFRTQSIRLPIDTSEEFKAHLRASVRVNEPDPRTGNMIGRWRESGPDHFAHALAYAVAASKRARASAAPIKIEWL